MPPAVLPKGACSNIHSATKLGIAVAGTLMVIVWLFLASATHGLSTNTGSKGNISTIDYTLYHHSHTLLQKVKALAHRHPRIMTLQTWKAEVNGYASEIIVVKVEPGGKRVSSSKKIRILLSFGQHGRELITCEVALRFLSTLAGETSLRVSNNDSVRDTLKGFIIKVVPMENVNGRKVVETGEFCERKNGRGVDINRNWSVDWGKKEKDFDPSEEFPGTSPFSEPETRIMRELASSFKPHLWINVHSGMEAMFMPYDYKGTIPDAVIAGPMKQLLQKLNELHCSNHCVIGSGGASVGYLAHGTATDYMYEALKVPLAFTFEIFGDLEASNEDCFRMFNPTTPALFERTVAEWCATFFTLFADLKTLLHSLPLDESTWRMKNEKLPFLVTRKKNEMVILMDPFKERQLLFRKKTLGALELAHKSGFFTNREWLEQQKRTLLEFLCVFLLSVLPLVSFVIVKCFPQVLARQGKLPQSKHLKYTHTRWSP